jgi:nicotinate-nucleotide adenylyltransferase
MPVARGGRKLGFLGGSFDPLHVGHLLIARDVAEHLKLDRVYLVPAGQAPLKRSAPGAPAEHRLAMARRAVAQEPGFGVLALEVQRGGISYTVDTARELRRRFARDRLFWILGSDQVAQLGAWREAGALVDLLEFAAVERAGAPPAAAPPLPGLRLHRCPARSLAISSTEIRERLRRGRSIAWLVPAPVLRYIQRHRLYRTDS